MGQTCQEFVLIRFDATPCLEIDVSSGTATKEIMQKQQAAGHSCKGMRILFNYSRSGMRTQHHRSMRVCVHVCLFRNVS